MPSSVKRIAHKLPTGVALPSSHEADLSKKLPPIYEALDSAQPKAALKLIQAQFHKLNGRRPLMLVALAALAHARCTLHDSDSRQEALRLLAEVTAAPIGELLLLQHIALVHRALGNDQRVMRSLYLQATQLNPKDEALMQCLFFAQVAEHDHVAAQQTAMKLYTSFKKEEFLYYNAVNQLLLHHDSSPNNRMLQLAEMMITRAVVTKFKPDEGMEEEDFRLLLAISLRQGHWQAAETLMHSPTASRFRQRFSVEFKRELAQIYEQLERHEQRLSLLQELLTETKCDWRFFLCWLDQVFADWRRSSPESISSERLTVLIAFLVEMQSSTAQSHDLKSRNPHLALVELAFRVAAQHDTHQPLANVALKESISTERSQQLIDALEQYFVLYGDKPCFFHDVSQYLHALASSARRTICERMKKHAGPLASEWPPHELPEAQSSAWRHKLAQHLSNHQCLLFVGAYDEQSCTTRELHAAALLCYRLYLCTLLLPPSSRTDGDAYLQLFTQLARRLTERTQRIEYSYTALALLEHALAHESQNNHELLVLAMRFHCQPAIASVQRAMAIFGQLEIKQILLESLSHLVLHDTLRYGFFAAAQNVALKLLAFHRAYDSEEPALLRIAYENKRWSRVVEMSQMRLRLRDSAMKRVATYTHRLASLLLLDRYDLPSIAALLDSAIASPPDQQPTSVFASDSLSSSQINGATDASSHEAQVQEVEAAVIEEESLVVNSDYEAFSCFEPPGASFHVLLNRPAPAHLAADDLMKEQNARLPDDTYRIDDQLATGIRLFQCHARMLALVIQGGFDSVPLRNELSELCFLLQRFRLVDLTRATPALDQFQELCWRFTFLIAETSACVLESLRFIKQMLDNSEFEAQAHSDHVVRTGSLQRQLLTLSEISQSLLHSLSLTHRVGLTTSVQSLIVDGEPKLGDKPLDTRTMHDVSLFLSIPCSLLNVCMQCWMRDLPNRKTSSKRERRETEAGNTLLSQTWSALNQVHEALAQLMASHKRCLQQADALLTALMASPLPYASVFIFTDDCLDLHRQAQTLAAAGSSRLSASLPATFESLAGAIVQSHRVQAEGMQLVIGKYCDRLIS